MYKPLVLDPDLYLRDCSRKLLDYTTQYLPRVPYFMFGYSRQVTASQRGCNGEQYPHSTIVSIGLYCRYLA
jgi:hypothetical protein